jgi:hypothetical protein
MQKEGIKLLIQRFPEEMGNYQGVYNWLQR